MSTPGTVAYVQVTAALRAMVLASPWDGDGMLPPEPVLVERFGVSRGTIRRATEELAREGLLQIERGRGTSIRRQTQLRTTMLDTLSAIAIPDSRWHLDVLRFVPDFEGSAKAHTRLRELEAYQRATTVFIAPDNSLNGMIESALSESRRVLIPTYAMRRGIVLLEPERIAETDRAFAATLDGLERFGRALSLDELRALGRIDLVVTGGHAFTLAGVHVGTGEAHLDIEWGILVELGLVDAETPVIGVAHPLQLVDIDLKPKALDISVDAVATPERIIEVSPRFPRPTGIAWSSLREERIASTAYLGELRPRTSWP